MDGSNGGVRNGKRRIVVVSQVRSVRPGLRRPTEGSDPARLFDLAATRRHS